MQVVVASMKYLDSYSEYLDECIDDGIDHYAADLDACGDSPERLLKRIIANAQGQELPAGYVPTTTYFCVDNGKILGALRLRHETTQIIFEKIGHIGYETRPSARSNGVAKKMLRWVVGNALNFDAIITCSEDNVASKRVIEGCGGHYLSSVYDSCVDETLLRFRVKGTGQLVLL